jgi:predicted HTH domain antitoxin
MQEFIKLKNGVMQHIIKVNYPGNFPDAMQMNSLQFEKEAKIAMAVKLFELKKLSSGMAAILAEMERVNFLLILHQYGVCMIDMEEDELLNDINNA